MSDFNAGFLLDIWHDLKEKRLAPVAVALLVALVAIPTLMMNGSGDAEDVALPVPISAPAGESAEVVVAEELADDSELDSYKARDPFKGLVKGDEAETPTDGTASAPIDETLTGVTDDTTGSSGGSPAPTATPELTTPTPDTSGGSGNGGGSKGGGSAPIGDAPVKKEPAFYNFRLDIKFGKPGRERRTKSMSRLSFLKVSNFPVALFLGVDESEKNALFLVTPGLSHQGQGKCIPSAKNCDFLSLGVGKEHYLAAKDREYRMELLGIKRVKVDAEKRERAIAERTAQRRLDRGESGADVDAALAPWQWPLLVDNAG